MTLARSDDLLDTISELLHERRTALASIARAEGLGPEDAVDCVQEAMCTLLTSAREGAVVAPPEEWGNVLGAMVRNAARNRRRRHHLSRPHEPLDDHPDVTADGLSADELIARAEDHVRLRACVEELCEIQKAVVTLRMLEERPGEDVATALGITPGYVAVLLHRAKSALHTCMTG
jgi:RNA polymerase sigma-70 factor, ECF subfamily